jgi:hypothetical protein
MLTNGEKDMIEILEDKEEEYRASTNTILPSTIHVSATSENAYNALLSIINSKKSVLPSKTGNIPKTGNLPILSNQSTFVNHTSITNETQHQRTTKKRLLHEDGVENQAKKRKIVDRKETVVPNVPALTLQNHAVWPNQTRNNFSLIRNPINELDRDDYTEKQYQALNHVRIWINYRLFQKKFIKCLAGLYLWSYSSSKGKTLLVRVLSKIFKIYWWTFEDNDWQQDYMGNYDCILYNAMNIPLMKPRQMELHGDREPIVVRKRNQRRAQFILPDTPFIITSNKPIEDLGYDELEIPISIFECRILRVCLNDCDLFPLIDLLRAQYNIQDKPEDEFPEGINPSCNI